MSFLSWHYTKGLIGLLVIARNFLWFLFEFFSIRELFLTLFSPWHRDVSQRYWRGFDPVRSVRLMAENAISRIIGAMVRFCVILLGLFVCAGLVVLLGMVIGIWVFFPLLLFGFFFLGVTQGDVLYWLGGLATFFIIALSFIRYQEIQNETVISNSEEFFKRAWFYRVLCRVGIDIPKNKLRSFQSSEEIAELLKDAHILGADFQQALMW
jgi:hypothetical protein